MNDGFAVAAEARHARLLEKEYLAALQAEERVLGEEVHGARVRGVAGENVEEDLARARRGPDEVLRELLQPQNAVRVQLEQRLVGGQPYVEAPLHRGRGELLGQTP